MKRERDNLPGKVSELERGKGEEEKERDIRKCGKNSCSFPKLRLKKESLESLC